MSTLDFRAINELTGLLRERKDALTIRWLYSTVGIGAFALIVAWFEQGTPRVPRAVTIVVWVISAVLAGVSIVLPRRQLTDRDLTRQLKKPADPQGWARAMKLTPKQAETLAGLPDLEQRLFGLTSLFEAPYNLGLKLAGALAVIGLLYGLVAGTLVEATLPLLGALALNGWHYPRLQPLVDRGRKLDSMAEDEEAVRQLTGKGPRAPQPAQPASASKPPPAARPSSRPVPQQPRLRNPRKR